MRKLSRLVMVGALFWRLCVNPGCAQMPPQLHTILTKHGLTTESVSLYVAQISTAPAPPSPLVAHRAEVPVNPASVMKLVTSYAALEMLGAHYTWNTPVYIDGAIRDGVLHGNLVIKGVGDPTLVMERLWVLLRRVQALGIHTIAGDIVLDRLAFDTSTNKDPFAFDGEGLRTYNVTPDALLINFKAAVFTLTPHHATGTATVALDPPLAGVRHTGSVPLSAHACEHYRDTLKANFTDPSALRFNGTYPRSCPQKVWSVAYPDPSTYAARAVLGMWQHIGGRLQGEVRDGRVPAGLEPAFVLTSRPLAEALRDVNKLSNNVMAQQIFLTIGLAHARTQSTNHELSRKAVNTWWHQHFGTASPIVLDNGAGLSRQERISAQGLGAMLQHAWHSPSMPEFVATLPVMGIDGTLRRRGVEDAGVAHLKTGNLRDAVALAGYVHGQSLGSRGKHWVFVGVVNSTDARVLSGAKAALDAAAAWVSTQ